MSSIAAKEPWTAGPWFVSETGFSRERPFPTVYATDDELRYIAVCADTINMRATPNLANARLIAESPTMAALLEEYVECSPCQNGCPPDDMECLTNRARACLSRLGRGK